MHTVNTPNLQIPNPRLKTGQAFIEKNPQISGPAQFKCVLVKGQLYITSWKRQNFGDNKKISGCQALGDRARMNRWNREFLGL